MDVPANWETMENDGECKRIQLNANDQEYNDAEKAILLTVQKTFNQTVNVRKQRNNTAWPVI